MTRPTEEFIARVLRDAKDALTRQSSISGYKLGLEGAYGGASREKMYAALAELERRGDLEGYAAHNGGHEGRRYALPGQKPPPQSKSKLALPVKRGAVIGSIMATLTERGTEMDVAGLMAALPQFERKQITNALNQLMKKFKLRTSGAPNHRFYGLPTRSNREIRVREFRPLDRRGMDSPVGRMEFLQGMRG